MLRSARITMRSTLLGPRWKNETAQNPWKKTLYAKISKQPGILFFCTRIPGKLPATRQVQSDNAPDPKKRKKKTSPKFWSLNCQVTCARRLRLPCFFAEHHTISDYLG